MPRPKLHSDDEILETAQAVLLRKGPSDFTLSDVAVAVGLSRAALIQRFGDKATLHALVMERMTQEVRDYFVQAPSEPGLGPLWFMLKDLIAGMGTGEGSEAYLLLLWGDVRDPALRVLANERNELVRGAIEVRLPAGPHEPFKTSLLIQAVIQGSCMQWMVARDGDLASFMTQSTANVLSVLYPDQEFPAAP
ncbi:TetR/AcrR family transcriptional regulator [Neoaquamicrobium sediminum]|uniref:TetR/AcrR family transcriptional regulator n=1 Tax=Neoaquamicrobium sediminum TaxID=1849104 RepID=UPI00156707B9|nr:helix-turn-helix domain-containing protein [Mesorhizobium sediminum]NRC54060.1 TetR/AcrR family transcriptional regulator [Mesorhizobium sediminum]